MKKTFIVSELFFPNKTSTAYIMTEIAKAISVHKKVEIVTAENFYDNNVASNQSLDFKNIKIHKTIKIVGNKNSFYERIKNSIGSTLSFGWFLLKNVRSNDIVFAVTNPFLLVLVLGFLRTIIKFKYVLLIHDVFPENAVPAGLAYEKTLPYKVSKLIFDWAYSKADEKIVLGRDMYNLVSRKSKKGNIHIIENWFDEDLQTTVQVNRNEYIGTDLDDKIVLGFSGNIGRVQNVLEFVEILNKVENKDLHLVIIGDGAESTKVVDYIESNKIKNVTYLGSKPRNEQSIFLSCFDIGLVTLSKGMYGLGVPSKTYNLLAMGKPIFYVGDKNSELDLLINENDVGWSNDWSNEEKIIQQLNSLNRLNEKLSSKAREIAFERFSQSKILERFNNILND